MVVKINSEINCDFWLFDDKIVLKINYNSEDRFLGFEEMNENISEYIKLKDKLLSIAKPIGKLK